MPGLFNAASREEVETELRRAAEAAYGPERAAELAGEIAGVAVALHRVAAKPLGLRDAPPPLS
ncbi:MAG TPA: hypothetical protein VHL09_03355 [Dehalococcoidia bacterium]|nr:hypothetical protein [Dehalococcoidia bacterium]